MRQVVNGVMYVLSTGHQWRYIPQDRPPGSTVHDCLARWSQDSTIEMSHDALYVQCREAVGREASQTAGVIDSQSVKSAKKKRGHSALPLRYRKDGRDARVQLSVSQSLTIRSAYLPLLLSYYIGQRI